MTILSIAMYASCSKQTSILSENEEIVIGVGSHELDFETRATAITSLPSSLYWGATTGTRGNSAETAKWTVASGTVSSSKISTGKYQTKSATAYNYYVANQTFTMPSTGNVTMSAANTTDVICGWSAANSSAAPSVTLNHIFARTGTLTLGIPSGYTSSDVSWKIVGKSTINGTAGTYNLSTGAWTAASTKLSSATNLSGSSDMYLIPGTYTVTVSFTLSKSNGFTKTYTQSGDVVLTAGRINNINATTNSDDAAQIKFTVSVAAWSPATVNGTYN